VPDYREYPDRLERDWDQVVGGQGPKGRIQRRKWTMDQETAYVTFIYCLYSHYPSRCNILLVYLLVLLVSYNRIMLSFLPSFLSLSLNDAVAKHGFGNWVSILEDEAYQTIVSDLSLHEFVFAPCMINCVGATFPPPCTPVWKCS
jgi:hypothetical protein